MAKFSAPDRSQESIYFLWNHFSSIKKCCSFNQSKAKLALSNDSLCSSLVKLSAALYRHRDGCAFYISYWP